MQRSHVSVGFVRMQCFYQEFRASINDATEHQLMMLEAQT